MKISFLVLFAALLCAPSARAADDPLPPPDMADYKEAQANKRREAAAGRAAENAPTSSAASPDGPKPWFRDAGDYLAHRSVRMGVPTESGTKLITDAKRFDATIGKRISLLEWNDHGLTQGWSLGIDGGMLASLTRYRKNGQLTFATNTFDGFFGAYLGHISGGWTTLLRYGHLSAHLVDSNPDIFNPVSYSQFWFEAIVGKTFPNPDVVSDWEIHLQGSVGANNTSSPRASGPRASLNASAGWSPAGPDKIALLASADTLRAGVKGQKNSNSFFLGFGTINRPNSTHRPFRIGVSHNTGSDYRNQYYFVKQKWTTAEASVEF